MRKVERSRKVRNKTLHVEGPPSLRHRIRLALLTDLIASEEQIIAAIKEQKGGKELLRDYDLGLVKVQAAQVRTELQKEAGIRGPRLTAADRDRVSKAWKAIPLADRKEIINLWEPRAAFWLSSYQEPAA